MKKLVYLRNDDEIKKIFTLFYNMLGSYNYIPHLWSAPLIGTSGSSRHKEFEVPLTSNTRMQSGKSRSLPDMLFHKYNIAISDDGYL